MNNRLLSILALMLTMLLVSCSGGTPPMQRDYADAVTNINQVDPYYRSFFRSQNSSNYTLDDQRRAYVAAMQTARTPVRARDYQQRATQTRLASRSPRKVSSGRRAVASRKAARGRKATVKRGKTSAKRRATASRRTPARRGSRRRG